MAKRVTKRAVDALQPGGKDTFIWDDLLPGFGCRCRPSGRKYYLLKYRIGRKQRWFSIGRHGQVTPDQARREARRLLDQVEGDRRNQVDRFSSGSDPKRSWTQFA